MENCAEYFENRNCEYFPCHKHDGDAFNCLFCYCPLYALGENCGGSFAYTDKGIKDCSNCMIPHRKDAYAYITGKAKAVAELAGRKSNDA